MTSDKNRWVQVSVAYFVAVVLIAHFFAPAGYDWTRNTISELASQGHAYKGIMQAGLIGFGLLLTAAIARQQILARRWIFQAVPVLVYSLAILLSGTFCTAPIDPSMSYVEWESRLHSIFASTAGVSLTVGMLAYGMTASQRGERIRHLVFMVAVITTSALFGLAEGGEMAIGKGLVQRSMHLVGLGWLWTWEVVGDAGSYGKSQ